jgi:diguanylate cyclase (GGDEF)-like protein
MPDTPAAIAAKREELLTAMSRAEAAPAFTMFSVMILAYTAQHLLSSEARPVSYTIVDLAQMVVLFTLGQLIRRDVIPADWVSWTIAFGVLTGVAGQTYDYTIDGEQWAILIVLTLSGSVILQWRPFFFSAAVSAALAIPAFLGHESSHGLSWSVAVGVALVAAAHTMRSRRKNASILAESMITVERMATVDPLTGLLNRRGLAQEVRFVRGVARRAKDPFFAIFVDVGGLKQINDIHGHSVGDKLLIAVADALRNVARETDLACRWGGDEFLVVGAGARPEPEAVSRRLLSVMDASKLPRDWDPVLWVGAAESANLDEDLREVIIRADEDLYANRSRQPGSTR